MSSYRLHGKSVSREEFMAAGDPGRLREMLDCATPPAIAGGDTNFMRGHCNGNQFEDAPFLGDWYRREAEAAGVQTKGRVYKSTLANFPGDPEAWVADTADVRALCEKRGWGCKGDVTVKKPGYEPEPAPEEGVVDGVAEDLVEQKVLDMLDKDPGLEFTRTPRDLADEAREIIKPHWAD